MRVRLSSCWRGSPIRHRPSRESRGLPSRVNRVILGVRRSLPVYPDKQTSSEPVGISNVPIGDVALMFKKREAANLGDLRYVFRQNLGLGQGAVVR